MGKVEDKLYTVDEFYHYVTGKDEDKLYELVNGEIREVAGSGGINTILAARIGFFLNQWVMPRNLGYVTGADGSYVLHVNEPDTVRIPDVGFITRGRMPEPIPTAFIPVAPDLAVEIVSPSETADDLRDKITDFLAYGTRLVWVVFPKQRTVDIHRPPIPKSDPRTLEDVVDGEDVLPGFTLPVKDIFADIAF